MANPSMFYFLAKLPFKNAKSTIQKNETLYKKIKSLKIQGAENITKQLLLIAIMTLENIDNEKINDKTFLYVIKYFKGLADIRPTEPMLRNCFGYLIGYLTKLIKAEHIDHKDRKNPKHNTSQHTTHIKFKLITKIKKLINIIESSDNKIKVYASRKIKNNNVVYTHCHSTTVMKALKYSKDIGKNFVVYNTETRPHFQGRKTAKELASYGIKVKYFVDCAMRHAIKHADIVLLGCDAITSDARFVNKIGTDLVLMLADNYNVPVYVLTNALKYDYHTIFGYEEKIEKRARKDFWPGAPRDVDIFNKIFEIVDGDKVTAFISELGVMPIQSFINKVTTTYDWIFKIR